MKFWELYNFLPDDRADFMTKFWQERMIQLHKDFTPEPPLNFLKNGVINLTMFMNMCDCVVNEYGYLKTSLDKDLLGKLLTETMIGDPNTCEFDNIITSGNTIHLLHHIIKYINDANRSIPKNILEWGGGYGNMCRLFHSLVEGLTYTIIDIKFFTCIQQMYLSQVFGKEKINVGSIKEGKINLIPIGLIDELNISTDMFVATWSISESTDIAQKYLLDKKVYNANQFLMAHQGASGVFPFADNLKKLINQKNIYEEEIPFLPGNFYMFA